MSEQVVNVDQVIPHRLSKQPLSAPVWLWILYVLGTLMLGFLTGTITGLLMVLFASCFSFQFWVFASWRGSCRMLHKQQEFLDQKSVNQESN